MNNSKVLFDWPAYPRNDLSFAFLSPLRHFSIDLFSNLWLNLSCVTCRTDNQSSTTANTNIYGELFSFWKMNQGLVSLSMSLSSKLQVCDKPENKARNPWVRLLMTSISWRETVWTTSFRFCSSPSGHCTNCVWNKQRKQGILKKYSQGKAVIDWWIHFTEEARMCTCAPMAS